MKKLIILYMISNKFQNKKYEFQKIFGRLGKGVEAYITFYDFDKLDFDIDNMKPDLIVTVGRKPFNYLCKKFHIRPIACENDYQEYIMELKENYKTRCEVIRFPKDKTKCNFITTLIKKWIKHNNKLREHNG